MTHTATSERFCGRIGMAQPIILAPMGGGPSTPELVAAVAEAGGLGSIAAGYLSADELATAIDRVRALTAGPLALNIFVPSRRALNHELGERARQVLSGISAELGAPEPTASVPDAETFDRQVTVAAESDAVLVSFTFGLPPIATIERLQAAGTIVAATANTFGEAVEVAAAGCDAVILQGFEAGAHRGGLSERGDRHVGLVSLLEQARGRLPVDVIASGGVCSGAGVAACLALGAAAVQIGTAFLVTDESGATPEWKKAVIASVDAETVITRSLTGRGARGVANELVARLSEVEDELPDYPVLNSYTSGLRQRAKDLGEPEFQSLWTGQSGSISRIGSARSVFDRIVAELATAADGLAGSADP